MIDLLDLMYRVKVALLSWIFYTFKTRFQIQDEISVTAKFGCGQSSIDQQQNCSAVARFYRVQVTNRRIRIRNGTLDQVHVRAELHNKRTVWHLLFTAVFVVVYFLWLGSAVYDC